MKYFHKFTNITFEICEFLFYVLMVICVAPIALIIGVTFSPFIIAGLHDENPRGKLALFLFGPRRDL